MTSLASSPFALPRPALRDALWLAFLVAVAGWVSILRGQDANWDLQNYHYYNPWAWWNGRIFGHDIAAAQLQTYHNPLFDLPFFAMVQWGWPPRLIAFVLAIPAGVAAWFLAKLLPLLFADLPRGERWTAVGCAFAIGVTSAMGIATLGTTMNESQGAALVLAGLWLIVRELARNDAGAIRGRIAVGAGLLIGLATGGKLTAAIFAVGLCVALLLRTPRGPDGWSGALREAILFGLGVTAATAVTLGPWAYALWTHFDNPLFPYFNNWFQSPWWEETPVFSRRYGPHRLEGWLMFPFHLVGPGENFVTEVPYRDARFPVAWGLAIVAGAAWLTTRVSGRPMPVIARSVRAAWRLTGIFIVVSFLLWTAQHSIYRYIVVLDMLAGAVIVTLLQRLLRPGYLAGAAVVAAVSIVATTVHADWWHVKFGERWFDVRVPRIEPNALVLLTSSAPMAYVLPFLPADARHVGVANTITDPERTHRLQQSVREAIRDHRGPLYQLAFPAGAGSLALASYGLERIQSSCDEIRTNMRTSPIELCRLQRTGDPAR